MSALATWERAHDTLMAAYDTLRHEHARGLDRESSRRAADDAEREEHAAWLAYRANPA